MLVGLSGRVAAGADPAGTGSSTTTSEGGPSAASTSPPVGPGASASKPGEEAPAQSSGEDKENDAAAVTAVIWKELAELSAVQAKLKVSTAAVLYAVTPLAAHAVQCLHVAQ